jgi:hypothetical protein
MIMTTEVPQERLQEYLTIKTDSIKHSRIDRSGVQMKEDEKKSIEER